MNNGNIFYNNLIGNSDVTVTSESPGFEAEYLYNSNQGVVWRSAGITLETITMAFEDDSGTPIPTAINGIVVLNHNLESGDTFLLKGDTDPAFGSAVTQTIDPTRGFVEVDWAYPYYQLQLSKSTGSYIQIGELYLFATSYPFERNYQWNYSYTREINRNSMQTTSGQVYRKTRFIRKGFNLDFDGITDTQKEVFEEISESDYLCFLPTGAGGDLHYGIIDFSSYTHVFTNYWSASMTFMENPQ